MPKTPNKPIDRWLGLGAIVVGIAYFWMPKTPATLAISLVAIFLLLTHPLWNFWWIEKSQLRRIVACICFVVVLVLLGRAVWPPVPVTPAIPLSMHSSTCNIASFAQFTDKVTLAPFLAI